MNDAPQSPLDPESLILLGTFATQKEARELSLVLRARNLPHEVRRANTGFFLLVQAARFDEAEVELEAYQAENEDWPPREEAPRPGALWARGTILYLATIVLLFAFQKGQAFGWDWHGAGRVDGERMLAGEWSRAMTALTLHADLVHLLSNMTYGALFGGLVAYSLGGGAGWLAILGAGALGNILNVALRGFEHRSIGASTAVFAAVGVLAGSEMVRRHLLRQRRLRRAAPLLVAFLLVSYLGMGGSEQRDQTTDVSAHVAGLLAGLAVGAPLGRASQSWALDRRRQLWMGFAAIGSLALAWALQHVG